MIPLPWTIRQANTSPRNTAPPLVRYWLALCGNTSALVATIHPIKSEKPLGVHLAARSLPLGFNSEHMNKLRSRIQYNNAKEAFFVRLLILTITLAILTFQIL
jgi:hypothetical protein